MINLCYFCFKERENKIRQNFKDFQIQKELQPKLAQEEIELRKKYENVWT